MKGGVEGVVGVGGVKGVGGSYNWWWFISCIRISFFSCPVIISFISFINICHLDDFLCFFCSALRVLPVSVSVCLEPRRGFNSPLPVSK